jgi:2-(1,2-epoxy-1,2-dihydrophenyl)acetyl-CoA isomerase
MAKTDTPAVAVTIEDGVGEIRLNRPEVLNALDVDLAEAFAAAVERVLTDDAARVVLISGEGRAFLAGGDLGAFHAAARADRAGVARAIINPMNRALAALAASPKISVAAIQGAAAGAGMSLALMTDLAIAAEDAKFNMAYLKVGANPDCGGSWALTRLVGPRKAMELALLSDTVDATEALRLGLINKVVPAAELTAQARALATRLAKGAPLAQASTKALTLRAVHAPLPDQLEAEAAGFARLAGTEDFAEALDAFFGKRPAKFTGR